MAVLRDSVTCHDRDVFLFLSFLFPSSLPSFKLERNKNGLRRKVIFRCRFLAMSPSSTITVICTFRSLEGWYVVAVASLV